MVTKSDTTTKRNSQLYENNSLQNQICYKPHNIVLKYSLLITISENTYQKNEE